MHWKTTLMAFTGAKSDDDLTEIAAYFTKKGAAETEFAENDTFRWVRARFNFWMDPGLMTDILLHAPRKIHATIEIEPVDILDYDKITGQALREGVPA